MIFVRLAKSLPVHGFNLGALIIGIGLGVYYIKLTVRRPQNPILVIKAPSLLLSDTGFRHEPAFPLWLLRPH